MSGSYSSYQTTGGKDQDFTRLNEQVSSSIQKINQNVASMGRMVKQLGTSQDTEELRGKLHHIQHYTNQLAKDTNDLLKELQHLPPPLGPNDVRQRKVQKERLTNEFTKVLNMFQVLQREAAQHEKESIKRARAQSNLSYGEDERKSQQLIQLESPVQNQTMMQLEDDVDLELLREREHAMHQLETDIVAVNEIFRDLGTMVHEQGEVVDSIEAQMESTHIHVGEATKQLSSARDYQSKARRKKFICFIILVVVVAIIVGIVVWKTSDN